VEIVTYIVWSMGFENERILTAMSDDVIVMFYKSDWSYFDIDYWSQ